MTPTPLPDLDEVLTVVGGSDPDAGQVQGVIRTRGRAGPGPEGVG